MRLLWTEDPVTFSGGFHQLARYADGYKMFAPVGADLAIAHLSNVMTALRPLL